MIATLANGTAPRPRPASPRGGGRVNVAFVLDNLGRAGTESQLLALLRSLDRSVIVPSLVLTNGNDETSRSLEPTEVDVLRLGVTKLFSPNAVKAANRLRHHWLTSRPDVVVAYFLDPAYLALPVAKWLGARTVRVRNNLGYWLNAKHRLLGKAIVPFTDCVLTNSAEGRAVLVKEGHLSNCVAVIENGVDLDRFPDPAPVNVRKPVVRIGCVGNLRPVKNIDGLIRAARVVCERFPAVRFDVAGEGDEREPLQRLIDASGLHDRVTLRGSVADVPAFLASCELAVLPSHSEGMSNALLESMAAGRAIVATDVGANRRVVGDAGVIVPPADDYALSAAVMRLIASPHDATHLGHSARDRAGAEYSRSRMVRRFEAYLHSLAEKTTNAGA